MERTKVFVVAGEVKRGRYYSRENWVTPPAVMEVFSRLDARMRVAFNDRAQEVARRDKCRTAVGAIEQRTDADGCLIGEEVVAWREFDETGHELEAWEYEEE